MRLLSLEQKDTLIGKRLSELTFFNPVQDINGNWILSEEEVEQLEYSEFNWIKSLPVIDWLPPEIDINLL